MVSNDNNIVVCQSSPSKLYYVGIVSLDRLPEYWWVSRVFVDEAYRRQHLGAQLVHKALDLVAKSPDPTWVMVAPGGYNTPYHVQCRFYESLGFRWHKDEYMWIDPTTIAQPVRGAHDNCPTVNVGRG